MRLHNEADISSVEGGGVATVIKSFEQRGLLTKEEEIALGVIIQKTQVKINALAPQINTLQEKLEQEPDHEKNKSALKELKTKVNRFEHDPKREAAMHELVEKNMGLVKHIASQYRGINQDDARQAGMEGLLIAARKFDPKIGGNFTTVAISWIKRYIQNELEVGDTSTLSTTQYMRNRIRVYKKLANLVTNLLGRSPTSRELGLALHYYDTSKDDARSELEKEGVKARPAEVSHKARQLVAEHLSEILDVSKYSEDELERHTQTVHALAQINQQLHAFFLNAPYSRHAEAPEEAMIFLTYGKGSLSEPFPTQERVAAAADVQKILDATGLSSRNKEIYVHYEIAGMGEAEIAHVYDMTRQNVNRILTLARKKIKKVAQNMVTRDLGGGDGSRTHDLGNANAAL